MTINKNIALGAHFCKRTILLLSALLVCSCASSSRLSDLSLVLPIDHRPGSKYSCLADCVNMVLEFYGVPESHYFAATAPLKLLDVDSLLSGIEFERDRVPYELRGFVLQKDETFLKEQFVKQRPTILVFRANGQFYHSVVMAGVNSDESRYFIHDPAKRRGQWISRAKLMKRWKSSENTLVLIALASE